MRKSRGWSTVFAAFSMMFTTGNFQYVFGVFVAALIDTFGWSRAAIAWSITIRNIIAAVTMPVTGSLSDRFGAKKFIIAGIIAIGFSYWLSSRITSLWHLYVSLGIFTGIGISLMVVPTMALVSRWFGGKSALANGVVYSGFGLAQIALPPLATWAILHYGWGICLTAFAIMAWVGGAIFWYFLKVSPKAPNLELTGESLNKTQGVPTIVPGEKIWTLSSASHNRALWILVFVNVAVAICFQIISIHIVVAAIDVGISAQAAAIILTTAGFSNTAGRLLVSSLAPKIGNKNVLLTCVTAQAVLMFFLIGAKTLPAFCIISGIYGFFYGGGTPMMPTITAEYFGTQSFGSIFGVVNMAYTLGAAIGPLAAGYIFDITGQYFLAFLSAGLTMVLAAISCLTLRMPRLSTRESVLHQGT